MYKTIQEEKNLEGKKVLVRVGVNVHLNLKGEVESDFRLRKVLPTIKFLSDRGAQVILMGHIGRDPEMNLEAVFKWFKKQGLQIKFHKNTFKDFPKNFKDFPKLKNGEILLLDNLRQSEKEKANDLEFSQKIASLGEIYVNEAFSVSHREHASMVGVPQLMEKKYLGLLFEEELKQVNKILEPGENSVAIMGGGKIKTKLPLIEKISEKFSLNVLGGGIANNFYKFLGYEIGKSLYDENFLDLKKYLSEKIFIPNIVIVDDGTNKKVEKTVDDVEPKDNILDISPNSFFEIEDELKNAKFVFFNGPLGYYENGYVEGTRYLVKLLASDKNYFIAGGGDTVNIIFELGLQDKVDWLSTGGGALIDYIADGKLPALEIFNWEIKESEISGKGIFSVKNLEKNEEIGLAFIKTDKTGNSDKDYFRTKLGAYVNHSDEPNLTLVKKNNKYFYKTLREIKEDEELFVNYQEFDWDGKRDF